MKPKEQILFLSLSLFIILLVFAFIKILTPSSYLREFVIYQNYNGIVVEKYVDKMDHSNRKINLLSSGKLITLGAEGWINLYETVNPGDSIVKSAGNVKLQLYRNNKLIEEFKYNTSAGGFIIVNRFEKREIN